MDTTSYKLLTEEQIENKLVALEKELWENYQIIPEQIQVDEDTNQLYFTAIEDTGDGVNPQVESKKNYIEDKYEVLI